ncbi:hypothetical protein [Pedobacter miscanthi]|nr:hypothetical protein [Pedobacter miscanthi]
MINTWEVLKHGERLISAIETPPSTRDLSFNHTTTPAFDMLFVQRPNGNYILIIYMRIKIIYINRRNQYWNFIDKDNFEKNFREKIDKKWGASNIKTLSGSAGRKTIALEFRFSFNKIGVFTHNHWTLNVVKLRKDEWAQSFVISSLRTGNFDTNDFEYLKKSAKTYQRGAVHEFGHMLGLNDEYDSGVFISDLKSIMNSGETIRQRHRAIYMPWLNKTLREKNIH